MKKISLISFIFLIALLESNAQSNIEMWSQKFDTYQEILPRVKLHLVFNQPKYSPGDTVWFKAYFLKEDFTGIQGKQLINVDLVDAKGKSRLHLFFQTDDGLGYNQFIIPDSLSPGIYLVTAYNNWMRNFDPMVIFKQEIKVVSDEAISPNRSSEIKFAVEGGHLIANISNTICVSTSRSDDSVQIIDKEGKEITSAVTRSSGLVKLSITPNIGVDYFIRMIGVSEQFSLPVVEENGCSLVLSQPIDSINSINLIVEAPPNSNLRKEELTMVVSSQGKIHYTKRFILGDVGSSKLTIPNAQLPVGITHVSLLKSNGALIAGRDFYYPGDNAIQTKINISKAHFHAREKVKFEVLIRDKAGKPIEGEFSVSVLNASLFDDEKIDPLNEWFVPDRSNVDWLNDFNDHLIIYTQPVEWKEILTSKKLNPPFRFNSSIQKTGTAFYRDTATPVPDLAQINFYFQKTKKSYEVLTSGNGRFLLTLLDVYGKDELFYLALINKQLVSNLKIVWDHDTLELPHAPKSVELNSTDVYGAFATKQKLIDRSYEIYTLDTLAGYNNDVSKSGRNETVSTDVTINVQDYVSFPTMEDLIKEVIPALYHRKRGGQNIVRVKYLQDSFESGDPVYIIDGIATPNTEFFLSLIPTDLLSVKVIYTKSKLSRFGIMGKNGIVIVQTRKADTREPPDPSRIIEGITGPLSFTSPDYYGKQHTNIPDFRTTIYWNPSVKTDSNGKAIVEFYASDDVGKLNIRVEGITMGRLPFSANEELEVSLSNPNE